MSYACALIRHGVALPSVTRYLAITIALSSLAFALRTGVGLERQEYEFFASLENLNDAGFIFGVEYSAEPLAGVSMRERLRRGTFVPIR